MSNEIHVDDVGTQLQVQIKDGTDVVDISGASILRIILKRPNGDKLDKNASLVNDGTDGLMQYVVESGIFNQDGSWKIQGFIQVGSSWWYTNIKTFKVERNL